jgi:hypothetical protein
MYPIAKGTVVRGNYSQIEYVVDFLGGNIGDWWVNCTGKVKSTQSGHFSGLGRRDGNEIHFNDKKRSKDRLIILKEPKWASQLEFNWDLG